MTLCGCFMNQGQSPSFHHTRYLIKYNCVGKDKKNNRTNIQLIIPRSYRYQYVYFCCLFILLCIFLFYREQNEELKRQAELKRTCELLNQHKEQLTQITKDKQGHSDSETLNGASDEDSGLFNIRLSS